MFLDLTSFFSSSVAAQAPPFGAYRCDGHGAAAHDPEMMVALLVYAYAGR
jgi:hypothetical protein